MPVSAAYFLALFWRDLHFSTHFSSNTLTMDIASSRFEKSLSVAFTLVSWYSDSTDFRPLPPDVLGR